MCLYRQHLWVLSGNSSKAPPTNWRHNRRRVARLDWSWIVGCWRVQRIDQLSDSGFGGLNLCMEWLDVQSASCEVQLDAVWCRGWHLGVHQEGYAIDPKRQLADQAGFEPNLLQPVHEQDGRFNVEPVPQLNLQDQEGERRELTPVLARLGRTQKHPQPLTRSLRCSQL